MEDCPPPYSSIDLKNDPITSPSAPEIYPDLSGQLELHSTELYREEHAASTNASLGFLPSELQVNALSLPVNPVGNVSNPMRSKCGNFEIALTQSNDVESVGSFTKGYAQLQDGVLRLATSRSVLKRLGRNIQLAGRYVSIEKKRMVALQGNEAMYLFKMSSESQAWEWMTVFSQYCYVAPMMEGYGEKYSKGSKKFDEKYFKLTSDGILSWYSTHNDLGERLDAIQARGETFKQAPNCPEVVVVQLLLKGKEYKFRFPDPRTSYLWLSALQWHAHRKPYKHPSVSIKNKAK